MLTNCMQKCFVISVGSYSKHTLMNFTNSSGDYVLCTMCNFMKNVLRLALLLIVSDKRFPCGLLQTH